MRPTYLLVFVLFLLSHGRSVSCGHEGHSGAGHRQTDVASIVSVANSSSAHQAHATPENFTENVQATESGNVLHVESNGLPEHGMMLGIRSWQQQVPLPQPYTDRNAWQIPLNPRLAQQPISTRHHLRRGAIALAVNGVPIFNALNNRGEDAYLAGELDRWGGHCGRGDDYHYHTAPVHLEKIVGQGKPIAFALDGFPIYGYTEPDGSPVKKLDAFNGHFDVAKNYHYHASKKYPYINGGMRGEVRVRDDQIVPQPRDAPIRPPMRPLRGATITGFTVDGKKSTLDYKQNGRTGKVSYTDNSDGSFDFEYLSPHGQKTTKTYQRREGERRPSSREDRRERRRGNRPPKPPPHPPR